MANMEKIYMKFDERFWGSVDDPGMEDWENKEDGAKLFRTLVQGADGPPQILDEVGPLDDTSTHLIA